MKPVYFVSKQQVRYAPAAGLAVLPRALWLLLLCSCTLWAGAQSRDVRQRAGFLFQLAHFVEWPRAAFASPQAPLVIGIVDDQPLAANLAQVVAGTKLDGHPIQVQAYASPGSIAQCHILFVGQEAQEVLQAVAGRSVLTVGTNDSFINDGGMVQLYRERKRLRFIIRPSAARAANLEISSKLLRLAQIRN